MNRLATLGGLQIEQGLALRSTRDAPEVVAEVVSRELAALAPPTRALGGFGPHGADDDTVVVQPATPPAGYPVVGKRVVAVQADSVISGHGAITNPATAWMLLDQVMT